MSYPQIQSTSDFLGALNDADYRQAQPSLDDNGGAILDGPEYLNFMNFEAAGSAVTYDSNSFAPDSASTATSISTGYKTYSGSINVDETGTISYETIAEQLHAQKGYSVGVITLSLIHISCRPGCPASPSGARRWPRPPGRGRWRGTLSRSSWRIFSARQ